MIKNVIFDFGQVLVRFEPEYMTEKYIDDAAGVKLVSQVVFDRLYWDRLDEGSISDDEVVQLSRERLPEKYHDAVREVYYNWIYNLPPISGMEKIINKLKEKGIRLFLLSNISRYFADNASKIPVLSHFEKCVFSAMCGYTKPNKEIFAHLCDIGKILPSETLFIDDNEKNINGARDFGIEGYLFDGDAEKLEEYLKDCKIL